MWAAILPQLIPFAIKLIMMGIEKKLFNNEQVKTFQKFIQAMATGENQSKKSRDIFSELNKKLEGEK